jgi:hypothetical protein
MVNHVRNRTTLHPVALAAALVVAVNCGRTELDISSWIASSSTGGTKGSLGGAGGAVNHAGGTAIGTSPLAGTAGMAGADCTFKGFEPAVVYQTAYEPLSIIAVDRTHRGRLDLLVGERNNWAQPSEFLINSGKGAFFLASSSGAPDNNVANMVSADFDGDGMVELASQSCGLDPFDLNLGDGRLGIDLEDANGLFAPQLVTYQTPQNYGYLAVGDFNRDGHADLAMTGWDYVESAGVPGNGGLPGLPGPIASNFALNVWFNAGDGTFALPVTFPTDHWLEELATGDFDGDGQTDIVAVTGVMPGSLGVFFNAGDGSFRSEVTLVASDGWITYGLAVADFDGDGKDDVATTTILNPNRSNEAHVLEVFTGADHGSFNEPRVTRIAGVPTVYQVVTGDFNGDAKPDVALVIGHDSQGAPIEPVPVSVFENLGDGTFAAPVIYGVGGANLDYATAIAAGDFNGDGVTDLAVATSAEISPYPIAVHVLRSKCE